MRIEKSDLINKIIEGDSVEVLKQIPDDTFDFCFADPPYFMQIQSGKKLFRVEGSEFSGCDDEWDKFESMEHYKKWTKEWLFEVRRVLKPNGTLCVISGMQSIYEIGSILRDLGFWVINDIIWQKSNPTPNFGGTRLNNSHETLIWASKSKKSKFTFNYKTGKHLNNGKQMGSVWTFSVCSGGERLKDENNKKVHSTQKPVALMHKILTLFTKKGDFVLDPFGGTMTTGVVAKQTGRNYTMIEKEKKYIKYGQKRLDSVSEKVGDVENALFDMKPEKVTMKEMTEKGCFFLGEKFFLKNGVEALFVEKSGKLEFEGEIDSMHKIAAKMLGKNKRVNGFDFLFVKRDGVLVSINEIRERYREAMAERCGHLL